MVIPMNDIHELERIAMQLQLLAREGHGGSEARLVLVLYENSHRLQQLSESMAKDSNPAPKLSGATVLGYLALVKVFIDLLLYLAS